MSFDPRSAGAVISRSTPEVRDVFGPTIEVLTSLDSAASAPAVLRGLVPPDVTIPMHAHGDPETFVILSGGVQALTVHDEQPVWTQLASGQIFHVPPDARHAFRNTGQEPCRILILSTPTMAGFFTSIGIPLSGVEDARRPPTAEELQQFLDESASRGYWNASPAENAAVGIQLGPPSQV
ncbi:dimethylsulfonioproprionate lyase family protein [Pedococcus sp. KACC 23699]|uniref:Dimethylsulfonioproprionate lyase family protein n=1 Tax=Pedococcus sp. KACC 23699 TaxID=3149228 RepID=A0AAU7JVG6_9MICO